MGHEGNDEDYQGIKSAFHCVQVTSDLGEWRFSSWRFRDGICMGRTDIFTAEQFEKVFPFNDSGIAWKREALLIVSITDLVTPRHCKFPRTPFEELSSIYLR